MAVGSLIHPISVECPDLVLRLDQTSQWGRERGSFRTSRQQTCTCSSICTSSVHSHPSVTQMEHTCSPTVRACGDTRMCAPAISAARMQTTHGPLVGRSSEDGDPWARSIVDKLYHHRLHYYLKSILGRAKNIGGCCKFLLGECFLHLTVENCS